MFDDARVLTASYTAVVSAAEDDVPEGDAPVVGTGGSLATGRGLLPVAALLLVFTGVCFMVCTRRLG
ncbi:MAG: hypothetical protein LBH11_03300 [Propionibacteriaceae bacterium]|jgi:hypothetical protein|nr:hypothetical protein [Propionibacteriaceae bacterium]